MQVTLEKIAVLDPVFDTFDAVGAFDEVGDPVPGEAKFLVRMHASLLWIACVSIYNIWIHAIAYMYTVYYIYMCVYIYVTYGFWNILIAMRM